MSPAAKSLFDSRIKRLFDSDITSLGVLLSIAEALHKYERIRIRDLPITTQMVYQLSYRPLDCQTAEIFLSTQLIGGHGGVVLLVMFSYLSFNTWP